MCIGHYYCISDLGYAIAVSHWNLAATLLGGGDSDGCDQVEGTFLLGWALSSTIGSEVVQA